MKVFKGLVAIIAISILISPTYLAKGEKMDVEKVQLDPEFVRIVNNITWIGINASIPVKVGYGDGKGNHVLESENLEVWKEVNGNWSEKLKFWERKDDGYYVGNIRVTGDNITGGEKRGEEWIVSTGARVYWYDGSLHSEDLRGKVALGMCFYVAYKEDEILKIRNLTSGKEKEIGKAKLFDIATDPLGYLHVVWWDGEVIRYWNDVPVFYYLLKELKNEGVMEAEKIEEYAKEGEWVNAIRLINSTLENLGGDEYYEMKYVKMYVWFEIEDPSLGDSREYYAGAVENKYSATIKIPIKSREGGRVVVKYEEKNVHFCINTTEGIIYTMPGLKTPTSLNGKNIVLYLKVRKVFGEGKLKIYINGMYLKDLGYGDTKLSIPRSLIYENKENEIKIEPVVKNDDKYSGMEMNNVSRISSSGLYQIGVSVKDVKVGEYSVFMDEDNDGLITLREWRIGTDPHEWDTDGDGMPDGWEYMYNLNPLKKDGNGDKDGDGLSNYDEYVNKLNPNNPDCDGDGLNDGIEVHGWSGEVNGKETTFKSNPKVKDSDGDGLGDKYEYEKGTNPRSGDTDGDSLPDWWELKYGLNANSKDGKNGKNGDWDGDDLKNYEEYEYGTNPVVKDTDGDGATDGEEVHGWNVDWCDLSGDYPYLHVTSNPFNRDTDGDGLSDGMEYRMRLNPRSKDTDGDGLEDGEEFYTKTYEYGERLYFTGSESVEIGNVKEDSIKDGYINYVYGLRSAKVIWGVKSDRNNVGITIYIGNKEIESKGGISGTQYGSVDIEKYVGIDNKKVKVYLTGKGWLEEFKVIIVENTSANRADTDGDGLSDGYEVNGKSGYRTNPLSKDTDGDGISDYWEINGWSWDYNKMTKYRNNKGFHTNPVAKDTDGDGYEDSIDANPLANLVLKMEVVKYHWDSRTVFVGFKANYSYNGNEKSVEYYTEHVDTEIDNHVYYFDIPDRIGVNVYAEWTAYYTKSWLEGGGDTQEWYEFTMQKVGSIEKTWNVEGGNITDRDK